MSLLKAEMCCGSYYRTVSWWGISVIPGIGGNTTRAYSNLILLICNCVFFDLLLNFLEPLFMFKKIESWSMKDHVVDVCLAKDFHMLSGFGTFVYYITSHLKIKLKEKQNSIPHATWQLGCKHEKLSFCQ